MLPERLTVILLLAVVSASWCQSPAPFELENNRAIEINNEVQAALLERIWHGVELQLESQQTSTKMRGGQLLRYQADNSFRYGSARGTWQIVNDHYIVHNNPDEKSRNDSRFGGTYAVTTLNDSMLVLTKLLSSSRMATRSITFLADSAYDRWAAVNRYRAAPPRLPAQLTPQQIDSVSRLTNEQLFLNDIRWKNDTIYIILLDTVYHIRRK